MIYLEPNVLLDCIGKRTFNQSSKRESFNQSSLEISMEKLRSELKGWSEFLSLRF